MLDHLSAIEIETPADQIVTQLKKLIANGSLPVGERLPSERILSERFKVGRGYVREAIRKLEFYGVLKTSPQRGTFVNGLGMTALSELISDVLSFQSHEFRSLMETRAIMEQQAAALAARRRTDKDIAELKEVLARYERKVKKGNPAVEEDLLFHLKIAEVSGNTVLRSLLGVIAPDLVSNYRDLKVCNTTTVALALEQHQTILTHIISGDEAAASKAMNEHLANAVNISLRLDGDAA